MAVFICAVKKPKFFCLIIKHLHTLSKNICANYCTIKNLFAPLWCRGTRGSPNCTEKVGLDWCVVRITFFDILDIAKPDPLERFARFVTAVGRYCLTLKFIDMNLQTLVQDTIANGGASYNLVTGEYNPATGYMVAVASFGQVIEIGSNPTTAQVQKHVAEFIGKNAVALMGGVGAPNKFVGTWTSGGKLFLDVSVRIEDMDAALDIAERTNELAIWDCANGVAIDTSHAKK